MLGGVPHPINARWHHRTRDAPWQSAPHGGSSTACYPACVVGRVLALLAGGATPIAVALLCPPESLLVAAPLCVLVCAAALLWQQPSRYIEWLLGCGFAVVATLMLPTAIASLTQPLAPEEWPLHDLTKEALPDHASGYVRVRGYLRTDWTLAEYSEGRSQRPDQNAQASYVLMPLLASDRDVLAANGRVVVVRLAPTHAQGAGIGTIAGQLRPIERELVAALFTVGAASRSAAGPEIQDLGAFDDGPSEIAPEELIDAATVTPPASADDSIPFMEVRDVSELPAVMLDATRRPTRGQRLTDLVLALVLLVGACWSLWRAAEPTEVLARV